LVFTVTDTGHGIADDDRDAIFEEFRRLDAGKDVAGGLGLGLSIVKRIADTLDHPLSFSSRPGEGSTFSVSVPLSLQVSVTEDVPETLQAKARKPVPVRVLCVDNEPRILDGMRALLEGWGCDVTTFGGSDGLVEQLDTIRPEIILADYHLDTETGLDVIAEVRAHLGSDLAAVLITADRSASVRKMAQAADVTMLNKPLKPAALRALVRQTMRRGVAGETVAAE
ncbi:MAG: ATP-binding protein, partial [Pseudomonadota bacterium]